MKKMIKIFSQKEFCFFIFGVYAILLTWPFLSIFEQGKPQTVFYYLFFMWALNIFILFIMSLGYPRLKESTKNTKKPRG